MATSSCHLVDSSGYPWRPRLSVGCGCSAGMEQSATRDSGVLLTFNILKGDQVSPFSSVIRLTWRCPFRPSADVCIELCNSFRCKFCKVPPQLCDGSTIILTSLVVSSSSSSSISSSSSSSSRSSNSRSSSSSSM